MSVFCAQIPERQGYQGCPEYQKWDGYPELLHLPQGHPEVQEWKHYPKLFHGTLVHTPGISNVSWFSTDDSIEGIGHEGIERDNDIIIVLMILGIP
jgi:hypothetical protein